VLWPPARGADAGNDGSVVTRWTCGGESRCLTSVMLGDLGAEAQVRMAGATGASSVDVVKVSHHGSADQSAALYEGLAASVGLIGVGADNGYGHPTESLLGILAASGTTAVRTDVDGLVLVAPGAQPRHAEVWTAR